VSERIAGLARLLRGYAQAGFEDQALWHERDISHSSVERVALPDATILLDYMLVKTTALVEGMVVNAARMRQNIERGLGLWASSRLLLALVESGMEREAAYRIVQRAALRAADEERPFRAVAEDDPEITSRLTGEALAAAFDEAHLLRNVDAVIARLERLTEPARVRG